MTMNDAPSTDRAARVGEGIGRTYARTTATLTAPIRRAPAPTWPHARVRSASAAAGRRIRNVPGRTLNGLRGLPKRNGTAKKKAGKVPLRYYLGGAFVTWWGGTWAAQEGVLPWLLSAAAVTGASAAYATGEEPETPTRATKTTPAKPPEATPADTSDTAEEHPAADPLLTLCWQLIGTSSGVHLREVVTALHQAGADPSLNTARVRAELEQRGVPTRASLKVSGRVTRGVHRDDLEAATSHSPDEVAQERPGTATTEVATASDLQ